MLRRTLRRWEVFSTRTGRTIAFVPFAFVARFLVWRLDRAVFPFAYDYGRRGEGWL